MDTSFYIDANSLQTSMIKIGGSQNLSDIIIPNDKRLNPSQLGFQMSPVTKDILLYDLSLDQNNSKVKLKENQEFKIFDDCLINFGHIVKYRF